MHRVCVFTDAETATGYRLAGVEVRVAEEGGAAKQLEALIEEEAHGLVIVDEGLVPDPVAATQRVMPIRLPRPSASCAVATCRCCCRCPAWAPRSARATTPPPT